MNKIVCVVGMCGSGKSEVSQYLIDKGFRYIRFGQLTMDIIKGRGFEPSEQNERTIREGLRKQHGMGAYAKLNLPKFDAALEQNHVVADGLYSWSEYKILKDHYGLRMLVIAVFAPPEIRYERLVQRKSIDAKMIHRPLTKEQAQSRDYAEIENIEKGGPIAMADYTVLNIETLDRLMAEMDRFHQTFF